jgi:hypothetical protein
VRKIFGPVGALLVAVGSAAALGCGGGEHTANPPTAATTATSARGGAPGEGGAAGAAGEGGAAGAADERPFAGSTAEATTMISNAVDQRRAAIATCVREFRARKKIAQERVAVSFGIDQEGRLLGVTSKGKEDRELKDCVQEAVRGAPFPRSHAGVITITKSYEELVIP